MPDTKVTFTLNRLVGALNKAADGLLREHYGLTYSQFLFLVTLNNAGSISSGALAHTLGVSAAAVSKRTHWFVQRGLVQATPSPTDGRALTLSLTDKGSKFALDTAVFLEEQFRGLFNGIASVNLDQLNTTLLEIEAHLRHADAAKKVAA